MSMNPDVIDQALPDGTTVRLRPLRRDDGERLLAMWARTSEESRRLRFHGHFNLTADNIETFTVYVPGTQDAVVATLGGDDAELVIGVARWVRDTQRSDEAEFAVLVEDNHQGRGVGSALVRQLAVTAHAAGIQTLSGDVLAENRPMLRLIRQLGFAHHDRTTHAVVRSDLGLELGEEFLAIGDEHERRASRAALARFLMPRSVAIVGASRSDSTIGGVLVDNVLGADYTGRLYLVNRAARRIRRRTVHASLADLPEVPELVVVAVPADAVSEVVDQAGALGCRAVCVISAGFAEAGPAGITRQADLLQRAHDHGLRLIGPNCMGLLSTDPAVSLNATLARVMPDDGPFAFSSQSGALGMAIIDMAASRGIGLSSFVSVGNRADISANELLQFWELDDRTRAILLYLESFGQPRQFARIARRVSRHTPIVAVKSGRSHAGARATGQPGPTPGDSEADALFAQTGMIRTDTLPEMFDVATLLDSIRLPAGPRVGIVSNAGGPGVLAADACEAHGLDVARLSATTRERLASALPDHPHVDNPLDLVLGTDIARFEQAIRILGAGDDVDMVLAIHIPLTVDDTAAAAAAIARARTAIDDAVPVVAIVMADSSAPAALARAGVPTFNFPEAAATALGRVANHAAWRRRPLGSPVHPDGIDQAAGRAAVDTAMEVVDAGEHPARRVQWLQPHAAHELLTAYGIPVARSIMVADEHGAADAQRQLDTPVAVKLMDPTVSKAAIGGIELGRRSHRAAAAAVRTLRARFPADDSTDQVEQRFMVQEMLDGIEMVVGVRHHPAFGPVIVTGLGGPHTHVIRDLAVRITPLTDRDIDEMIDDLRMRSLLEGRHGARGDIPGVKDLLARVNAMVEDLPEVVEMELNPVFVMPHAVTAADVRARVGHSNPVG